MQAIGGYFELAEYEEGRGFPHQERHSADNQTQCVGI